MTTFSDLHEDDADVMSYKELGSVFGNTWYVDSGAAGKLDAAGNGTTPTTPFATLDYAIGAATANNGDMIFLAPGHAETKGTGSLWAADQAGIRIVGLGQGADRPTFTLTHTASVCTISAASVWMENVVMLAGIDLIVAPLTISAPDCTLKNVEFRSPAAVEFITPIITTAAADRLTLDGVFLNGDDVSGDACTIGVALIGADQALITNCRFQGVFSTAAVNFKTTKSLGVVIKDCVFNNVGTALTKDVVESVVDCTFSVANCFDMVGGYGFSGSDTAALASDDAAAIAAAVVVVDGLLDVAGANNTDNATLRDLLGNKTDTAATGAVTATDTLTQYIKQLVTNSEANTTAVSTVDGLLDVPGPDVATNTTVRDVVGNKTDAANVGAVAADKSLMAYAKEAVTQNITAAAALVVVDGLFDVPTLDVVDNVTMRDVIGNKDDTAHTGATEAHHSLMSYVKQNVAADIAAAAALVVIDEFMDVPGTNNVLNAQMNEVLGSKLDDAAVGAVDTTSTLMAYAKQLVGSSEAHERCIAKINGVVLGGTDNLFTIAGGPILCTGFVGIVTTDIGVNGATLTLQETVTTPAGARALSTAVAIDTDAAGTSYSFTDVATPVLTPTTNGYMTAFPANRWLLPIGTIQAVTNVSNTGVIAWYMTYKPLSPLCVVTAV